MDFRLVIRHRLSELGADQKALAAAAQVTESYISQLLNQRKLPPAPERTDIYDRMETFLRLPAGHLATLAGVQREDALSRQRAKPSRPLFREVRELILYKCVPKAKQPIRELFEREPFGALERLVTQKLLEVSQRVTRESTDERWLRRVAQLADRTDEQMRIMVQEFLETDVFTVSAEHCKAFLEPLIEAWNIDLATFAMEIVLNRRLVAEHPKTFEFVERETAVQVEEPGLQAFLQDASLSDGATAEEIEFLKTLSLKGQRPTPLYYYRELQNLRDPLHFHPPPTESAGGDALGGGSDDAIGRKVKQHGG
jgi:transcriptional regulator with XRE-family HTH domain